MVKIKKEKVLVRPCDIKPSSKDFEVIGTFNPGAMRLSNGDIILYVRVLERLKKIKDEKYFYSPRFIGQNKFKIKIDKFSHNSISEDSSFSFVFMDGTKRLTYISHLRKVILDKSGLKVKSIDKKPSFFGLRWDGELGIEDARITKIGNLYVMTYVSLSRLENVSTSYAISNDGTRWFRRGVIFSEQNKDVVIFPELVNKKYVAINRPEGSFEFSHPHMWISYSKDMELWGRQHPLIISKQGDWDFGKVGAGPPPIKIEKGWLLFYHGIIDNKEEKKYLNERFSGKFKNFYLSLLGIDKKNPESIYCVGAALFDLKNPGKLILKTKSPLIFPNKKYEKAESGDIDNQSLRVVFPTGLVLDENKKDLLLFLGAGDRVVTVKKISLKDVFDSLDEVNLL